MNFIDSAGWEVMVLVGPIPGHELFVRYSDF